MSEATPEPRIAALIVADALWEDQAGTPVTACVRMVNKSASVACIQSKLRPAVGAKIRVQSRWDDFTGIVKYCKPARRQSAAGSNRFLQSDAAKTV